MAAAKTISIAARSKRPTMMKRIAVSPAQSPVIVTRFGSSIRIGRVRSSRRSMAQRAAPVRRASGLVRSASTVSPEVMT